MESVRIPRSGRLSELPLAAAASSEVTRLRSVRDDLLGRRAAIDRELKTVNDLIETYVSYQPRLAGTGDRARRARKLGATLLRILADHPDEWLDLERLRTEVGTQLPGVDLTVTRLRNALYHLVKTGRAESSQSDSGIQYRVVQIDMITHDNT